MVLLINFGLLDADTLIDPESDRLTRVFWACGRWALYWMDDFRMRYYPRNIWYAWVGVFDGAAFPSVLKQMHNPHSVSNQTELIEACKSFDFIQLSIESDSFKISLIRVPSLLAEKCRLSLEATTSQISRQTFLIRSFMKNHPSNIPQQIYIFYHPDFTSFMHELLRKIFQSILFYEHFLM